MIDFILITGTPGIAKEAETCGIGRIFVDLEVLGKKERQGHLNTVISNHTMADLRRIRPVVKSDHLMVRLNPVNAGSKDEIDQSIDAGADLLMVPMVQSVNDVNKFCGWVGGRVPVVPLIETPGAVDSLNDIVHVPGVSEIYIGLNDLHLALKQDFMFEPLTNGLVDRMATTIREAGLPFGFGGIARVGEGHLPGELVLSEHLRLGSSWVILSRTFHRNSRTLAELHATTNLEFEIAKFREVESNLHRRNSAERDLDRQKVLEIVDLVTAMIRKEKEAKA